MQKPETVRQLRFFARLKYKESVGHTLVVDRSTKNDENYTRFTNLQKIIIFNVFVFKVHL